MQPCPPRAPLASPDQALTAIMGHLGLHSQKQSAKGTTEYIGHFIVSFVAVFNCTFQWQSGLLRAIIIEIVLQPSVKLLVASARCMISCIASVYLPALRRCATWAHACLARVAWVWTRGSSYIFLRSFSGLPGCFTLCCAKQRCFCAYMEGRFGSV